MSFSIVVGCKVDSLYFHTRNTMKMRASTSCKTQTVTADAVAAAVTEKHVVKKKEKNINK